MIVCGRGVRFLLFPTNYATEVIQQVVNHFVSCSSSQNLIPYFSVSFILACRANHFASPPTKAHKKFRDSVFFFTTVSSIL